MKKTKIYAADYLEKALQYFIEWYTGGKFLWGDLSEAKRKKISSIVNDKNSLDSIGEFLVCAILIEEGYEILHANISFATFGNASERGIDGILEKDNTPFVVEIKTNPTSTKSSFDAILNSVLKQLEDRFNNLEKHFIYVADLIEDRRPHWIGNYNEKKEWFIKNTITQGYIVTSYDPAIKSTKHFTEVFILDEIGKELLEIKKVLKEQSKC